MKTIKNDMELFSAALDLVRKDVAKNLIRQRFLSEEERNELDKRVNFLNDLEDVIQKHNPDEED